MNTTLSESSLEKLIGRVDQTDTDHATNYPGNLGRRQPVHVVYGGAHLFNSDTAAKLGKIAEKTFVEYCRDAAAIADIFGLDEVVAEAIYPRIIKKLQREAVEDLRIDFEDGYGVRSHSEEDGHAVSAAVEFAKGKAAGTLPPFTGIRIKALSAESASRAIRTLDLFLTTLIAESRGRLPENFVVTLPKIIRAEQVGILADICDELESKLAIESGKLKIEIMIETPQAVFGSDGSVAIPSLVVAARGRCVGAHFGPYDYTSSLGITAAYQDMLHPACDLARNIMQISLAGTGVFVSDGATNILPIASHKKSDLSGVKRAEIAAVIHRAWKLHFDHCRHSLENGIYQGWDLHPAQILSRYVAIFSFFFEGLDSASERLTNFIDAAARATLVGNVFDDAASGQGLLNFFHRGINCGALTETKAIMLTGLTRDQLQSGSFSKIIAERTDN